MQYLPGVRDLRIRCQLSLKKERNELSSSEQRTHYHERYSFRVMFRELLESFLEVKHENSPGSRMYLFYTWIRRDRFSDSATNLPLYKE